MSGEYFDGTADHVSPGYRIQVRESRTAQVFEELTDFDLVHLLVNVGSIDSPGTQLVLLIRAWQVAVVDWDDGGLGRPHAQRKIADWPASQGYCLQARGRSVQLLLLLR